MTDIAARIRERLDLNGHEDWCPAVIHKRCCGLQCECATGGLIAALREVLGTCDRIEVDLWGEIYWPGRFIAEFRCVIAEALGVSSPDSPAGNAGVLPVGDTTSDGDAA